MKREKLVEILAVFGLTLAAFIVRIYLLDQVPFGLHNDEAANGLDALSILNGRHAIFFPANSGREALFLYLQAASLALFGVEPYALRMPAAIIGTLTIPAVYWMVRETFETERADYRWIAFWTAAFTAFSYWHIAFSRLGYRAILVPLTSALAFAFFWRAWRKLRDPQRLPWLDSVLCGLCLGIGMYTYIAARIAPLLVVLLVVVGAIQQRSAGQSNRRAFAILALITVSALVVFLPLGFYFIENPQFLGSRAAAVSIFSPEFNGGSPIRAIVRSAYKFVGMFLTEIDLNERHNPAQRPLLGLVLGVWATVGLAGVLLRWRRLPYLFVLFWVGLFALPSLLTLQGIPHSLRAIGMIPGVFLLIVLGMAFFAAWIGRYRHLDGAQTAIALAVLPMPFFLLSAATSVRDYFDAWETNGRLPYAFHRNYVDLMQEIAASSSADDAWVIPLSQYLFAPGTTNYTMDFAFDGMAEGKAGHAVIVTEPFSAAARLTELARGHHFINVIEWPNPQVAVEGAYLQADEKGLFPFLLQAYGEQIGEFKLTNSAYTRYHVDDGVQFEFAPGMKPVDVTFGNSVRLTGVAVGGIHKDQGALPNEVQSGGAAWVVLRWEPLLPINQTLKAGLRLLDQGGYDAGRGDQLLVGNGYPFDAVWPAGEVSYTYHILPTRAAIAPDNYKLAVTVYEDDGGRILRGQSASGGSLAPISIAELSVTRAEKASAITPDVVVDGATFHAGSFALLGYDLPFNEVAPGARLPLTLYWQRTDDQPEDFADPNSVGANFGLRLLGPFGVIIDEMRTVHGSTMLPDHDGHAPQAGDITRDWQDVRIPTSAENGSYALLLMDDAGEEHVLAELVIEGRPRSFDLPPLAQESDGHFGDIALLRGLELPLPSRADAGSAIDVPLVWEAQRDGNQPLVRFVHVLNSSGQLVAQQDSVPCAGGCPTDSWLAGEILRDVALISLPSNLAAGDYAIVVGFYDPTTADRVPAADGLGTPLDNDIYFLPGRIQVDR